MQLYYCGRPGTRFLTATASTITLTLIRPSLLLPGRSRVSAARASLRRGTRAGRARGRPPRAAGSDSPADRVALVNAADSEPGRVRPGSRGSLRLTGGLGSESLAVRPACGQ